MNEYPPTLDSVWYREDKWDTSYAHRVCLIKHGQIESVLYKIKELRENKEYTTADAYRDKLTALGRMWHEPKISHHDEEPDKPYPLSGWTSNDGLLGHFDRKLEYKIDEEMNISVEGVIDFGKGNEDIYYATR